MYRVRLRGVDDIHLVVRNMLGGPGETFVVELSANFTAEGAILAAEPTERKALEEARRILELAAETAGRRMLEIP